jgi:hypothetical protein
MRMRISNFKRNPKSKCQGSNFGIEVKAEVKVRKLATH